MADSTDSNAPIPVTVARGDGIGPEIMDATLRVLDAAGANLAAESVEIGQAVYERGVNNGVGEGVWDALRRTRCFLKAPITTPQGGGFKSLNVTTRKTLGLFANVRPCVSYHPFVRTRHPGMDVTIVRENEEDTYAGIEHRQTQEVTQCLKLVSRPGCERVVRYAFDYAVRNGRRRVTAMTKDNIMKMTDGLFRSVFQEVAAEYPQIETEHLIVDIGAARIADSPGRFDVIVTPNLYGDILSDIAAQVAGSVGLVPSANVGGESSMFEAIHGSAPDIAGKGIANPSGLLLAGVMMLRHLGRGRVAAAVHNAWLAAVEDGCHTIDMRGDLHQRDPLGTGEFADAVVERLGREPTRLTPVTAGDDARPPTMPEFSPPPRQEKKLVGVDVFLDWDEAGRDAEALAKRLDVGSPLRLKMITNRGVKVWPDGSPETLCTDHWRCRFVADAVSPADVIDLLRRVADAGLDFVKTEHLYTFDGTPGYSAGQGE